VMDRWFGGVHAATVELLRRSGYRVVVPSGQGCCGALAAHQGDADEARRLARRNVAAFAGIGLVVADAAGCSAHLKEYGQWLGEEGAALAARVRDITEVIADAIEGGRLPQLASNGQKVAIQDPCHLRHVQRVVKAPRLILQAAGYQTVEIDPDAQCCGAAGIYSILRPKESAHLGRRIAERVRATGALVVASANPGCEIQLRSHLGPGFRIAHPVELYAERLG
jgi:glycolate oxidase iron-sulfur subunit